MTDPRTSAELQPGDEVERYTVESVLGQGGMATVYRVRHTTLGSLHALKVLKADGSQLRARLLEEGRAQAKLRHPNVVAVTDVLTVGDAPGLVMEFVAGPSLDVWLKRNRPSLEQALALFDGILDGVARAHRAGLVHRDLKPANVLVDDEDGRLVTRVTDFGLVKALAEDEGAPGHTQTGIGMGTPPYMAPEQLRDAKTVDARADVFALGCILYELVCGERAFPGSNTARIFAAAADGAYVPPEELVPDLPGNVRDAIVGALEPERERRIADCEALRAVLRGPSVARRPPPSPPKKPREEPPPAKERGWLMGAVGAVTGLAGVLLCAGGVGGAIWYLRPDPTPPEPTAAAAPPVVEAPAPEPVAEEAVVSAEPPAPEPAREEAPPPTRAPASRSTPAKKTAFSPEEALAKANTATTAPAAPTVTGTSTASAPGVDTTGGGMLRWEAALSYGKVVLGGSATSLKLNGRSGSWGPGAVPTGSYTAVVTDSNGMIWSVRQVTVWEGHTTTITCGGVGCQATSRFTGFE